jgi:hypothetical protein
VRGWREVPIRTTEEKAMYSVFSVDRTIGKNGNNHFRLLEIERRFILLSYTKKLR